MKNANVKLSDKECRELLNKNMGHAEAIAADRYKTEELLEKAGEISSRVQNIPGSKEAAGKIPMLCHLLRDWYNGKYTQMPMKSIFAIVAALIYFVDPVDVVPDFIPIAGYLDDMTVIGVMLNALDTDINKYVQWQEMQRRIQEMAEKKKKWWKLWQK